MTIVKNVATVFVISACLYACFVPLIEVLGDKQVKEAKL